MARDAYLLNDGLILPFHLNLFAHDLGLFPLALVFVLIWVCGVKFLDIEILHIGYCVGDAPGDMLIMSDDDSWCARKAHSGYIKIARDQVAFVPD